MQSDLASDLRQLVDAAEKTALRIKHLHFFAARDLMDAANRAKAALRQHESAELDRSTAAEMTWPDGGHAPTGELFPLHCEQKRL